MFRLLALAAALLTACAAAPVQEMSDARQAGAADLSPQALTEAQGLMERAEKQLELGEYAQARESALSAKQRAAEARQDALKHREGN